MRNVFPPRVKPASPKQGPAYPPLKNIHAVPNPVDYDRKLGFTELSAQKCRTRADLHEKHRRGRLPGLTAVDLDDDGVIDTTEIRLAAVLREMDGAEGMSEADKIRHGRKLLAKELIMDMDQMEYLRMGKQFENVSREAAVDMIATDPNFRQHFNAFLIKKATAKLMSSTAAKNTLQQMTSARREAEQSHAAHRAAHERNIWRASKSRAAELARNINTADRFRLATEGFNTLGAYNNFLARNKDVSLARVNRMKP